MIFVPGVAAPRVNSAAGVGLSDIFVAMPRDEIKTCTVLYAFHRTARGGGKNTAPTEMVVDGEVGGGSGKCWLP